MGLGFVVGFGGIGMIVCECCKVLKLMGVLVFVLKVL